MTKLFLVSVFSLSFFCGNAMQTISGPQYFTTADSVKIMFVDKGDPSKTPIIFIQGSDGSSFEWQVFSKRLEKEYRLILSDRRGMGLSSRLLPSRKLTMENYMKDIITLMEKLDIKKCVLLGWSFGGSVVAEFALKYPDKVSSLILVCPLSDANQLWLDRAEAIYPIAVKNNDTAALATIDKLKKGKPLTIDDEYSLVKVQNVAIYNTTAVDSFYKYTDSKAYGYNDTTLGTDWENIIAQKNIYDNYSNLSRISKIICPTLIICGTEDHIITPKQCYKIQASIAKSKLQLIEKCGHMPCIERPNVLEKSLRDFVK
jgi:proline-specific peptidase